MGLGISLGVCLGLAFGVAIDNVAVGLAIGMGLGVALGVTGCREPDSTADTTRTPEDSLEPGRFGRRPHSRWRRL